MRFDGVCPVAIEFGVKSILGVDTPLNGHEAIIFMTY